ncbi:unnamed protein product [Linum tenue]|uniref:DEK-C domain-containing protein n=1 Tax=Linum tenue TaxID=586396 RepID=A0AAV0RVH4_9ROSI|nr:unnamed protein product [Linum tenue]
MAAEKQGATQPAAKDPAEINDAPPDVESQIRTAMRSRVDYFKDQADSLTFEGVRRVLEKDLGLEKFALDVHKRFVKQWLLEGAVDGSGHQDSTEKVAKAACSIEEAVEIPGEDVSKLDTKDHDSEEEKMEDSPVMGLLTGHKKSKTETNKNKDIEKKVPSESIIKKTILKRASYIGANSESITMAGLRRLLEEDLKLDSCALDPFKKFISTQLDEVLQSPEIYTSKKKTVANKSQDRFAKGVSIDVRSDSSGKVEDEQDVDEANPKRKVGLKERSVSTEGPKKRKSSEKESKVSGNKQSKRPKTSSHDNSESADEVNASDNGDSQSSQEKPVKKREPSTPAPIYGKRVEHLKSVIKSCGMSVPPAIYKKVKQVPEKIKEVRRRKERAKELEGIDMSNIVSSSRRRSTSSYVPPPKPPKVPIESDSDSDEAEDEDDDDNNEHEDVDNDVDEESESEELEDKGK